MTEVCAFALEITTPLLTESDSSFDLLVNLRIAVTT